MVKALAPRPKVAVFYEKLVSSAQVSGPSNCSDARKTKGQPNVANLVGPVVAYMAPATPQTAL